MSDFFEMRAALDAKKASSTPPKRRYMKILAVVGVIAVGAVAGGYEAIREAEKPYGFVSDDFCKIKKCQVINYQP